MNNVKDIYLAIKLKNKFSFYRKKMLKNKKNAGRKLVNSCSFGNRMVKGSRNAIKASARRRKKCWNRSHNIEWMENKNFPVKGSLKHIGRRYWNLNMF